MKKILLSLSIGILSFFAFNNKILAAEVRNINDFKTIFRNKVSINGDLVILNGDVQVTENIKIIGGEYIIILNNHTIDSGAEVAITIEDATVSIMPGRIVATGVGVQIGKNSTVLINTVTMNCKDNCIEVDSTNSSASSISVLQLQESNIT